jgi:nuclear pore complex protein Nup160
VRHLVAVLCEDDEVDKLCAYAFLDLQTEVEQTLQFKARNTDVFSGPNYYRIMYSYYVMRGDYRSGK